MTPMMPGMPGMPGMPVEQMEEIEKMMKPNFFNDNIDLIQDVLNAFFVTINNKYPDCTKIEEDEEGIVTLDMTDDDCQIEIDDTFVKDFGKVLKDKYNFNEVSLNHFIADLKEYGILNLKAIEGYESFEDFVNDDSEKAYDTKLGILIQFIMTLLSYGGGES